MWGIWLRIDMLYVYKHVKGHLLKLRPVRYKATDWLEYDLQFFFLSFSEAVYAVASAAATAAAIAVQCR